MIALAFALLATACGDSDQGATDGLDRVVLQMQFTPDLRWAPWLYGIEHGIFESHGIDLEVISGQGSGFAMLQLNEGQADIGLTALTGYLVERARGESPTMAVMVAIDHPLFGILTTVPAESLEDLVGHRVASAPFSVIPFILPMLLREQGLPGDAIAIDLVDGTPALLIEGVIEASFESIMNLRASYALAEEFDVPLYFVDLAKEGFDSPYTVVVARQDFIEANPDLTRRFVAATLESIQRASTADPGEVVDIVRREVPGLDRASQILEWVDFVPLWSRTGMLAVPTIETNLNYVGTGMEIEHDLRADDVFTSEYLPAP